MGLLYMDMKIIFAKKDFSWELQVIERLLHYAILETVYLASKMPKLYKKSEEGVLRH